MKLLLALVALFAAVAATGYGVNTVSQDTNTGYQNNGRQQDPGYNHVFDDFDIPRRHHKRHHGRHHRDSSDSSDSDSRSWSRSDSRDYSSEYVYLPRSYGAQNPPSYGAASNDPPAQTAYGAPAQDSGNGY
ncbi:Protein CBG14208 [Caenorhabditis briggsae]|uniref:Uncharacterized protein n=2 Tax=Caenorhabditis briggsae TaxID=6238 RepID=A0AAE9CU59_CAEBR|nr:Protein CBG14208 [Caenorhabditis briggsae]ULT81777.1 hypothetical protein L3Y34_011624 [Caenorhabditis briggsae]UMM41083.1 hypothetical protein L5515_017503 [Caenorhabditis briggsae]CAP32812.1 Protein CBG14208 [Caenorhabditis briggsae]